MNEKKTLLNKVKEFFAESKKGKIVVVFVAIALIIVFALSGVGGNYKSVAVRYADAYYNFDYNGIRKHLPYDVDEMFYDMFMEYCDDEDLSVSEGLEWWGDEFDTTLDSVDGMLKKCCQGISSDAFDDYKASAKIVDTRKMEEYEIDDAIEDNNYEYDEWGVELDDYVDTDKIKKAYEVELEISITEDGDVYTDDITYVVVKYSGSWKVLTIFNPDMY